MTTTDIRKHKTTTTIHAYHPIRLTITHKSITTTIMILKLREMFNLEPTIT